MNSPHGSVHVTIDNRAVEIPLGSTILKAAEASGIYIPTLCAHKDLTPFGGCRICIVEVEGMRGFPTACTTPVEEGMIVRTQTAQIQSIRNEIFNLILSEHPASCLICDEKDQCKEYSVTVRKVGVTTGCRFCPNDGQCELQDVADKIGVTELNYPIYYRNLPVEKDDPFYDRDYNLCILCGRCVRICQEVRTANAIAFKQRGRHTVIGPAFKRTHLDAGCEFCGACVSVCPTGALSEKSRKWRGKEDRAVTTTCPLCGIGCQINVLVKQEEVMGVLPAEAPELNNGQLCVKGRFCIPEAVNTYKRMKRYQKLEDGVLVEITPDEAMALAAEKLATCTPDSFGLIISPDSTNEDFYVAQKFAREAIGSNQIDTTASSYYDGWFSEYLKLFSIGGTLEDLRRASVIVAVGLDTRYGRSVMGVELRQAMRRGALIVTIHPRRHNLSVIADVWLKPPWRGTPRLLNDLMTLINDPRHNVIVSDGADKLDKAAAILRGADSTVTLIGSEFTPDIDCDKIYAAVDELAKATHARILPLPAAGNLVGSIFMGAYRQLSPGGGPSDHMLDVHNMLHSTPSDDKTGGLYLIGVDPAPYRGTAEFIISQNSYPAENAQAADLVFPAAMFTEVDGTMYNQEKRLLNLHKCVDPPGDALPNWQIVSRLAARMGKAGFEYATVEDVQAEIPPIVKGAGDSLIKRNKIGVMTKKTLEEIRAKRARDGMPTFRISLDEHIFRGYPLSRWVGGMRIIQPVDTLYINPADAAQFGLADGEKAAVSVNGFERVWPVIIDDEQPSGEVRVAVNAAEWNMRYGLSITIRKHNG
ncbi:MAG: molybdopterin-dependent oxidoreductase [candidate division Zixibacteria bacterium]|nr:molybdopterin-dependent oxidoreductase [candidate division Zixibacteria bacterium]